MPKVAYHTTYCKPVPTPQVLYVVRDAPVSSPQLNQLVLGGFISAEFLMWNWHKAMQLLSSIPKDNTSTPYTLHSLCLQWESSYSLPDICHYRNITIVTNNTNSLEVEILRPVLGTGKNISIAGVLAGILFILLIIAIILRLRQTKLVQVRSIFWFTTVHD